MRNIFTKNKKQKGYAILFTVVIVSALAIITAGLTSTITKQLILSSLAKDSQSAFYEADTASDCALYADQVEYEGKYKVPNSSIFDGTAWHCGGLNMLIENTEGDLTKGYSLSPQAPSVNDPCFRINVKKSTDNGTKVTTISAKGYNICNTGNLRTVEREILTTLREEPPV